MAMVLVRQPPAMFMPLKPVARSVHTVASVDTKCTVPSRTSSVSMSTELVNCASELVAALNTTRSAGPGGTAGFQLPGAFHRPVFPSQTRSSAGAGVAIAAVIIIIAARPERAINRFALSPDAMVGEPLPLPYYPLPNTMRRHGRVDKGIPPARFALAVPRFSTGSFRRFH